MGFLKRVKNIVDAKMNTVLEKYEDPIEMLELSISKKQTLLKDAKKQCAEFIGSVDGIKMDKRQLEEKVLKYENATKAAILNEDTQKAQEFIKQKIDFQEKLSVITSTIEEQEKKIDVIKVQINELESEISNMESKKNELATRISVADISNGINETLSGINCDNGISLDEIEKKIIQKENYGKALEDLKPKNEDDLLDEYIKNSPFVDSKINDELERLKKELENKN